MKVKVNINRKDFWKANKYAMLNLPVLRVVFILLLLVIPVYAFITFNSQRDTSGLSLGGVLILSLLWGLFFFFVIYVFGKMFIMLYPINKPGVFGEHIIEINEDGVRETTSVNETTLTWDGVYVVKQNKAYIFIFINNMAAHIIPKRSFDSIAEAEKFYHTAAGFWNNKRHLK
jgi:hypothetical protein